jgi:catechol 2,3-dioxygenase-like lactoylglutathione lyase family enzyme
MRLDHVAVTSDDIPASVGWYVSRFGAQVLYQDATWAFLKLGGSKLALVKPQQHPPHVAMSVTGEELKTAATAAGVAIQNHRDGSRGIYLRDPSGNAVELISYPPGETVYAQAAAAQEADQETHAG